MPSKPFLKPLKSPYLLTQNTKILKDFFDIRLKRVGRLTKEDGEATVAETKVNYKLERIKQSMMSNRKRRKYPPYKFSSLLTIEHETQIRMLSTLNTGEPSAFAAEEDKDEKEEKEPCLRMMRCSHS